MSAKATAHRMSQRGRFPNLLKCISQTKILNISKWIKKIFNSKSFSKLLLHFFQIVGLLPVKLDRCNEFMCFQKVEILISLSITVLHCLWLVSSIIYISHSLPYVRDFNMICGVIVAIHQVVSSFIIKIIFIFSCQNVVNIANKFVKIIDLTIMLDDQGQYLINKSLFHTIIVFSVSLLLWASRFLIICMGRAQLPIFLYFPLLLNAMILDAVILQYSFLICFIKREIEFLYKELKKMNKQYSFVNLDIEVIPLNNSSYIINKLNSMSELYSKLYELSKQISDFYSISIFLCIFQMFTSLVIYMFALVEPLIINMPFIYVYSIMYCGSYAFMLVYLFLILAVSSESAISEVSRNN